MSAPEPNTPPVFDPVYRASPIASCPQCMGDCIDEGFNFWCPQCGESRSPAEVGWMEDTDDHDD